MQIEVKVRRLPKSWQFDFKIPGLPRERKGGFSSKGDALMTGRELCTRLQSGGRQMTFAEAFDKYMEVTQMKDRTIDKITHLWSRIKPVVGSLYIEQVTTSVLDELKLSLPEHLGPRSVNHHLELVRAVLRFMWKREKLMNVPYIPMERVPKKPAKWYTQQERDILLDGMFHHQPQWYLFFYLSCRLGLRCGEVYAISREQISRVPPQLRVDKSVQRGTRTREATLKTRKNDEEYTLELTQDVLDAIDWHIEQGYAGEDFLFSKDGSFPRYIDSHVRPLQSVQRLKNLPMLSHHAIGRHSVASQAATGGESIKVIQMQLGHRSEMSTHKYAHPDSSGQLRLVEALTPVSPPHGDPGNIGFRVNEVSTSR